MVRETLARVPFLNPAITATKTNLQQTATVNSRLTANVRVIPPGIQNANPVLNVADPIIMVEPLNIAEVNVAEPVNSVDVHMATDPLNIADLVHIAATAPEAPMRINRRHSCIHGRNI
jgi:hypothetical protein